MANREELGIIRGARGGDAACQLALGKLYLFGGASLPLSMPTALHWLSRAAQQGQREAWMLIGSHIPFEQAQHSQSAVLPWYERAFDAGVVPAGLVLAQLVFSQASELPGHGMRVKALRALESAVRSGSQEAQWLLAHHSGAMPPMPRMQAAAMPGPSPAAGPATAAARAPKWPLPARAPTPGPSAADYASLARTGGEERSVFLLRALPLVRTLLADAPPDAEAARARDWRVAPEQLTLLAHCAGILNGLPLHDPELHHCRELAAHGGERHAQLALGLWFARMNGDGERRPNGIATVNFKRAIRWLTLAGEQGLAQAWFALARIYVKPEFSQRCVAEAQLYLERAADLGHCGAQLECGMHAWRTRRAGQNSDVKAIYWLQKAARQGCGPAQTALDRIAAAPGKTAWASGIVASLRRALLEGQPLLAARIELAELFGLSRAEALLLDVNAADQGHCLVVDIRASYGRSKRRLILLRTAHERQVLDRITHLFEHVNCGLDGLEGNYRQRLYRLKTWLQTAACGGHLVAA
jgi:TPR repeat protein